MWVPATVCQVRLQTAISVYFTFTFFSHAFFAFWLSQGSVATLNRRGGYNLYHALFSSKSNSKNSIKTCQFKKISWLLFFYARRFTYTKKPCTCTCNHISKCSLTIRKPLSSQFGRSKHHKRLSTCTNCLTGEQDSIFTLVASKCAYNSSNRTNHIKPGSNQKLKQPHHNCSNNCMTDNTHK